MGVGGVGGVRVEWVVGVGVRVEWVVGVGVGGVRVLGVLGWSG